MNKHIQNSNLAHAIRYWQVRARHKSLDALSDALDELLSDARNAESEEEFQDHVDEMNRIIYQIEHPQ